jgi:hypothetical protein
MKEIAQSPRNAQGDRFVPWVRSSKMPSMIGPCVVCLNPDALFFCRLMRGEGSVHYLLVIINLPAILVELGHSLHLHNPGWEN